MKKDLKKKTKNLFIWLKNECKDWRTFFVLICVIAIMYAPVWGGYLLYYIFRWNWCLVLASLTLTFWFGPFTPFFPLCIAITLSIKKLIQVKNKKNIKENKGE